MKKSSKSRILSLLLTVIMVVGMLPLSAMTTFAAGSSNNIVTLSTAPSYMDAEWFRNYGSESVGRLYIRDDYNTNLNYVRSNIGSIKMVAGNVAKIYYSWIQANVGVGLSAAIVDDDGNAIYYGELADQGDSYVHSLHLSTDEYYYGYHGSVLLEIPATLEDGEYDLYFFPQDRSTKKYGWIWGVKLYVGADVLLDNIIIDEDRSSLISVSPESAKAGDVVTLSTLPHSPYFKVSSWDVTDLAEFPVEVSNDSFIMPETSARISANWHYHTFPRWADWENKSGSGVLGTCSECGDVVEIEYRDVSLNTSSSGVFAVANAGLNASGLNPIGFRSLSAGFMHVTPGSPYAPTNEALHDSSRDSFNIAGASLTADSGEDITLNYTGAGYGEKGEAIYAFITKKNSNEVRYYGKLRDMNNETSPDGTITLKIPRGIPSGNYTVKVVSMNMTKFANDEPCTSDFVDIPLTVRENVPHSVTVLSDGNGKVATDVITAMNGDTVGVYAVPNEGYYLAGWETIEGNVEVNDLYTTGGNFIMPNHTVVLKAVFKKINTITVISPDGVNADAEDDEIYDGCYMYINAESNSKLRFKEWKIISGNAKIDNPTSDWTYITTGDGDVVIEAVYQNVYHLKTVDKGPGEVICESESLYQGYILPGETVYLQYYMYPDSIYQFKEWSTVEGNITILENDDPAYSDYTHYFIMPEENVVIRPVVEKDPSIEAYHVNIIKEGMGYVYAGGEYIKPGETVWFEANPDDNFVLKEIQVISGGVTLDEEHKFIMPHSDVTIKVVFEKNPEIEGYLVEWYADEGLSNYARSVETPDGEFISLEGDTDYISEHSDQVFFKEWEVIKGDVEFIYYEYEYYHGEFETLYGFFMPDREVILHAVAYPIHYFHDWKTESVDDEKHRIYCDCGVSVTEYHYRDWGEEIKKPTHTEEGIYRRYCRECDYYYDEPIDKTPEHEFHGSNPFCDICGATKTNESMVTTDDGTSTTTVKENTTDQLILTESLLDIVSEGNSLVLEMKDADVNISDDAVQMIKNKSGDFDIKVMVSDDELLTESQKEAIPPEYKDSGMIVVDVVASVGGKALHELGGSVTLTIPYDTASISAGSFVVYYLPESGEAELIENVVIGDGYVSFTTDHFSAFALGLVEDEIFSSINIIIDSDININFYAKANGTTKARFTMNGKTVTVDGESQPDGEYKFEFTGVAPQFIGDTITAELFGEDDTVIVTKKYSVLRYLNKLKRMTAEELGYTEDKYNALQTLINHLLIYGGAVQRYAGYKTDVLLSENKAVASIDETDFDLDNNGTNASFTGATVNFNNINRMKIYFTADDTEGLIIKYKIGDGVEQEIEYVDGGNGEYVIITPGISASDFTNVFTFTAYKDDVASATLTYSVKSYTYAKQNSANEAMADLAKATYNYGKAAKLFAEAK